MAGTRQRTRCRSPATARSNAPAPRMASCGSRVPSMLTCTNVGPRRGEPPGGRRIDQRAVGQEREPPRDGPRPQRGEEVEEVVAHQRLAAGHGNVAALRFATRLWLSARPRPSLRSGTCHPDFYLLQLGDKLLELAEDLQQRRQRQFRAAVILLITVAAPQVAAIGDVPLEEHFRFQIADFRIPD